LPWAHPVISSAKPSPKQDRAWRELGFVLSDSIHRKWTVAFQWFRPAQNDGSPRSIDSFRSTWIWPAECEVKDPLSNQIWARPSSRIEPATERAEPIDWPGGSREAGTLLWMLPLQGMTHTVWPRQQDHHAIGAPISPRLGSARVLKATRRPGEESPWRSAWCSAGRR